MCDKLCCFFFGTSNRSFKIIWSFWSLILFWLSTLSSPRPQSSIHSLLAVFFLFSVRLNSQPSITPPCYWILTTLIWVSRESRWQINEGSPLWFPGWILPLVFSCHILSSSRVQTWARRYLLWCHIWQLWGEQVMTEIEFLFSSVLDSNSSDLMRQTDRESSLCSEIKTLHLRVLSRISSSITYWADMQFNQPGHDPVTFWPVCRHREAELLRLAQWSRFGV